VKEQGHLKKILVIGASSGIGLEVVRLALEKGYAVRAFARSADRIAITDQRLEKHRGSALNRDDVTSALQGMDVVILTLGIPAGPEMFLGPVCLFSEATRILIPAMKAATVPKLICVTGFGAGDSRSSVGCVQGVVFRILLGRAYDDKTIQEELVRSSGLQWIIARPVILTNGPQSRNYRVLDDPRDWRNGLISRADVADFLVTQIDADRYVGKTPVLAS
jgi:putative NADH-flavin reductase